MAENGSLLDELWAVFQASSIVADACKQVSTNEGLNMIVRIHFHLRQRHKDLMYLDSFEHEVAIARIKLENE